jgi:cysteinyl-tRNA synthetase
MTQTDINELYSLFSIFVFDILGLKDESEDEGGKELTGGLIKMILDVRQDAKNRKDFGTSDKIRDELNKLGITIKDRKDGADWELG